VAQGPSRERRYLMKSALSRLPRSWQNASRRIVVLCYHSVHPANAFASATPRQFDEQMAWLNEHCDVISLREAIDRATGDDRLASKPTVSITFDDGYDDNFFHAFPALERHGIEASFYVTTGFLDRDPDVVDRMRRMRGMAVNALSWSQLTEMRQAGMTVGSHTISHRNLAKLGDDAARAELRDSRHILEDRLGEEIDTLAYPFGIPGRHLGDSTLSLARDAGYKFGMAVLYRDVRRDDHALCIPRIAVKANSVHMLKAKIAGSLDILGRWQEYRARRFVPPQRYDGEGPGIRST
jgi:peptidoglycan/xylan/chitin deacetylase (PgdA/CDA1 family)